MLTVVLRQVQPDWLAREPDNPYVAVFAPLLIADDADLRARAPALWRTVWEAPLTTEVRDILTQVLEFWFFERFRGLTAKEVWAMLNVITPIQETKAYQSIFAEGKVEGKAEGKADDLKRLLRRRFNAMPAWATQRIDAASIVGGPAGLGAGWALTWKKLSKVPKFLVRRFSWPEGAVMLTLIASVLTLF